MPASPSVAFSVFSRPNAIFSIPISPTLVLAFLLTCLAGCGGPRKAAVYPVAGTLTVGGRPAANAMVAFHPLDQVGSPTALAVASTGLDGTYRLRTYAAGDGAPAGEYAVTVVWPDDSQPRDECEDVVAHDRFGGTLRRPGQVSLARHRRSRHERGAAPGGPSGRGLALAAGA